MRYRSKNSYQTNIVEYRRRREKLREKFPARRTDPAQKEAYNKAVEGINKKICSWGLMIRKIEEREKEIEAIASQICDFLDIPLLGNAKPLRNSAGSKDNRIVTGRNLLYKYAIERGYKGIYVSMWVGGDTKTAGRGRLRFTRSFKNNSENKRIWDQFNFYLKHNVNVGEGGYISLEAA